MSQQETKKKGKIIAPILCDIARYGNEKQNRQYGLFMVLVNPEHCFLFFYLLQFNLIPKTLILMSRRY